MMKQACMPCAKRKVRCDRGEPCSNCKRRKRDTCTYVEPSPPDRIKQLEALVRQLGGDPDDAQDLNLDEPRIDVVGRNQIATQTGSGDAPRLKNDNDPTMVKEDGEPVYLESSVWYGWTHKGLVGLHKKFNGLPPEIAGPHAENTALMSLLQSDWSVHLAQRQPSLADAQALWTSFYRNVDPLHKMTFKCELEGLRVRATTVQDFDSKEHAFLFALYLLTTVSLSEDECLQGFGRPRCTMIAEYQLLCEQALARSNILGASNMIVLQALAMYVSAGLSRINTRSLSSLMGLISRHAERLGCHRDGRLMGLRPFETEKRRRIWWQLQHLDLTLSIWSGALSLTLMADWDTELPLNIEDDDINAEMEHYPSEREGLTSMSYCLWLYWLMHEQRSYRYPDGHRYGFMWPADKSLPNAAKEAFIERLEKGVNSRFLQFCDPIKPLDTLLHITGRSFIAGFSQIALHPQALGGNQQKREALLEACIKCLEYHMAIHSTQSIQRFQWRFKHFFPWSALVHIILEASKHPETPCAARIRSLLLDLYSVDAELRDLMHDQRRYHAAEMIVSAWKAHEKIEQETDGARTSKPSMIIELEERLLFAREHAESRSDGERAGRPRTRNGKTAVLEATTAPTEPYLTEGIGLGDLADLDFDDIDWLFWEGVN